MHDFYRVPPELEPQLQACFDEAGLPSDQVVWGDSPCRGYRRCQVLWLTPAQQARLDALAQGARQKEGEGCD
jgi:hypothetical protein